MVVWEHKWPLTWLHRFFLSSVLTSQALVSEILPSRLLVVAKTSDPFFNAAVMSGKHRPDLHVTSHCFP